MCVARKRCKNSPSSQHVPEDTFRRQPPRRKHFYSWVATDKTQLQKKEKLVLQGLLYYYSKIAGLNIISTDDIRELDDNAVCVCVCVADLSGIAKSEATRDGAAEHPTTTPLSPLPARNAAAKVEKDVIVFIHGFAGGVAGWAQSWCFLSENYRVHAFDLPWFARSERRASTATSLPEAMNYFGDYIHGWLERLDFGQPVIVLAHSFGWFVAAHYAMRHGAESIKLLLLSEPWGLVRANANRMKKCPLQVRVLLALFYNIGFLELLRAVGPVGPWLLRRLRPDLEVVHLSW
ncbi:conserved hypothetical protein [Leishmania major strain Friedlin]|uniref:AB hydrolase-1 domain-containing protein n=1 Tax=Leishmania major TaxID=5664 RepID=Q4QBG1_LEIMA|nr:conserved hypothetical protein [Leishmania major strain Friedlin]CAG9574094.1 Alpha/beta_hydrolase_family/alpha/beta_hydrolase_fold/Serine_hydrolase_-_putative [Leishmania major strain Friedlin]CAJ03896.1 conserved hypothetical protein [Leishmania major strain Friedlin]|eukprot:XP_001683337.1 conserved hypothetical protein [Leishmania major strain Friedlin]